MPVTICANSWEAGCLCFQLITHIRGIENVVVFGKLRLGSNNKLLLYLVEHWHSEYRVQHSAMCVLNWICGLGFSTPKTRDLSACSRMAACLIVSKTLCNGHMGHRKSMSCTCFFFFCIVIVFKERIMRWQVTFLFLFCVRVFQWGLPT
jgi:hypothetical protein